MGLKSYDDRVRVEQRLEQGGSSRGRGSGRAEVASFQDMHLEVAGL
jgi:hypothetical protein